MSIFFSNPWNLILTVAIVLAFILAVIRMAVNKKKGKSRCAGCTGGSCENCPSNIK